MKPSGNPIWVLGDVISITKLNNIENALKNFETVSSLPAAGSPGRIVLLSSDNRMYLDDGISFKSLAFYSDIAGIDLSAYVRKDGTVAMTGELILANDPNNDLGAVTKRYADAIRTGLLVKDPAVAATTGNITLSGLQIVDDIQLYDGDRVLVKAQNDPTQNGVWVAAGGAWYRPQDVDNTPGGEVRDGMYIWVDRGIVNAGTKWVLRCTDPVTIGTTALNFVHFSSAEEITATGGITKTGATISLTDGGVTDTKIGNRTVSDAAAPTGDTGVLTTILGWLANMVKSITGEASWRTAPAVSLKGKVSSAGDEMTGNLTLANSTAVRGKTSTGVATNMLVMSSVNRIRMGDVTYPAEIYSSVDPTVKVGANAYTFYHSGNFDPATKANLSGATFTGPIAATGGITNNGQAITVDNPSAGNIHLWLKSAGVNRGLFYYDATGKAIAMRIYADDATYDSLTLEESGVAKVNGSTIHHTGNFDPATKANLSTANTFSQRQTFAAGIQDGDGNQDVSFTKSAQLENHTRSTVLNYTSGVLTSVQEKDGATVVKTTTLTYTGGVLTGVTETVLPGTASESSASKTLNYTNGVLTSVTRA